MPDTTCKLCGQSINFGLPILNEDNGAKFQRLMPILITHLQECQPYRLNAIAVAQAAVFNSFGLRLFNLTDPFLIEQEESARKFLEKFVSAPAAA
jgi:hypothetical protein